MRQYKIEVVEENGTVKVFDSFVEANSYYNVRKDYLNYCFIPRHMHFLKENGRSIRRMTELK